MVFRGVVWKWTTHRVRPCDFYSAFELIVERILFIEHLVVCHIWYFRGGIEIY